MSFPPLLTVEHVCRIPVVGKERAWRTEGDVLWAATEGFPDYPLPLAIAARRTRSP